MAAGELLRRRAVLKTGLQMAALATGAAAMPKAGASLLGGQEGAGGVKRVLVVFKCHLDVGFTATQAQVMRLYFDEYFPAAMKTASQMRKAGGDRYVWTTGSWLVYEYLEQASPAQRQVMEAALRDGDLAWHALPFSWETEMLDASMISGAIGFSQALDARYGKKTIGAKMTDVPGQSRGIIAPLQAAGVRMLDIGVNAASTPPEVPDVFLWKDPAGRSVVMVYHRHDYGSVVEVPGSELAIDVEVRNDNGGPHTPEEIAAIYTKLRTKYPGATVQAATLSEVAAAIEPYRERLPVVTAEIGDTWIYGVASDPPKVARYREVARLRQGWLAGKKFGVGDATDRQLLRRLALAAEHTWGTDTKRYVDKEHYRPKDLEAVIGTAPYQTMETSWKEKRDDIDQGVATLPEALRTEAMTRLAGLSAGAPTGGTGMTTVAARAVIKAKHYELAVDPKTGAITQLLNRKTKRQWATAERPLALFTYQTLSAAEYTAFIAKYLVVQTEWGPQDFGKPNVDAFHPVAAEWHPTAVTVLHGRSGGEDRVLLRMRIEDATAEATGNVSWPREVVMEVRLPDAEPVVHLQLWTMGKAASRMPEAMWLTFQPATTGAGAWTVEKVGQEVAVTDVVEGGGRAMHAVTEHVRYREGDAQLEIATMDAPMVALGKRSPLNYSRELPDMTGGVHVGLFNNAWGTNYLQWYGGDWSYRFRLRG